MARRKSSWTRQSFYPIRFLGVFLRLGNLNWLQEMMCLDLNTARSEKHIYGKLNATFFFNTCCQMCKCEKGMSSRCDLIHPDRSMAEPMSMPRLYLLIGKIWNTLRGSKTTRCFRRLVFQKRKLQWLHLGSEASTRRNISIRMTQHNVNINIEIGPFELKSYALTEIIFSH